MKRRLGVFRGGNLRLARDIFGVSEVIEEKERTVWRIMGRGKKRGHLKEKENIWTFLKKRSEYTKEEYRRANLGEKQAEEGCHENIMENKVVYWMANSIKNGN